jgi:hypothetical protein
MPKLGRTRKCDIKRELGIKFDNPGKFNEEFAELLNIEINFEWEKVVIDFDKENVSLKIDEMMILIPFIQEVQNG